MEKWPEMVVKWAFVSLIHFYSEYISFISPSKTLFYNQNIWAFLFECSGYHYNIWNKINITTELSYMYGRGVVVLVNIYIIIILYALQIILKQE